METTVTITQSAEDFERDQMALENAFKSIEKLKSEVERLNRQALKDSIEFERLKAVNMILASQNITWLQEFEERFKNIQDCDSPAIAQHYMDCARFMEMSFGRTNHSIKEIKDWYDNYSLPFKRA